MKKILFGISLIFFFGIFFWLISKKNDSFGTESAADARPAPTSSKPLSTESPFVTAQPSNRWIDISSKNLAEDFAELERTAKNDPALAYVLAKGLFECRILDQTIDAAKLLNEDSAINAEAKHEMATSIETRADRCGDLTDEQIDAYADMLDFAAASGIVRAQLEYSDLVAVTLLSPKVIADPRKIDQYKAKSMKYYNLAALSGERDALLKLALAHSDGIVTPKDPFSAYKYMYTYSLSTQSPRAHLLLQQLQKGLNPQQIEETIKQAAALRQRCCV